jgi:hypothetical protein
MPRSSDLVSGGEAFPFSGYSSGQRFSSALKGMVTQEAMTAVSGSLILCPFVLKAAATVDRLAFYETGSTPAGTHKLAFYDATKTLIATAGTVATIQSGGLREATVSQALGKGLNYVAIKTADSWGLSCRNITTAVSDYSDLFSYDGNGVYCSVAHAYATAFPSTAPAMTTFISGIPLVYLRVA